MDAEARRAFFGRALEAFRQAEIPFLVGGAYALRFFADVRRETKDLDVFIREKDWPAVRRLFEGLGYRTRLVSRFWLAKVTEGEWIIDLIFGSRNGLCVVDEDWFKHAVDAVLFGATVRMVPLEEMIWSKAFVMERDRYDGADVAHLLLRRAEEIRGAADGALPRTRGGAFEPPHSFHVHLPVGAGPDPPERLPNAAFALAPGSGS